MVLWTIQPRHIWELIQNEGVYICDPAKFSMPEFAAQYNWLVERMTEKLGPPPSEVKYPVWAWYKQDGKRAKPDLRRERWGYGPGDEEYCCIEIDLPDEQVFLSDFDAWGIILNNGLLSESEEEDSLLDSQYDSMTPAQQQLFKRENWNRVFDLTPVHSDWIIRGEWIQATFWVLKKEDVLNVVFFRTAKHRR